MMIKQKAFLILALLIGSYFNAFAIKDSSDATVNLERLERIEKLSKGLYDKIHPTHCQTPGDDCKMVFENNKMPINGDEFIKNSRLLESEIPMKYNAEVGRLINYFGTSWQSKLKEMIVMSNYYFPIYEEIFDKYDMPLEIKYLSVIESALNPNATSKSGAAGLWQFMHATGQIFDLKVNNYLDERRNVEKSTEAACQYLKKMYSTYGDWYLVIASYNCGPGNVNKAIRKSGGKRTFWEIYPYLPKETQNYVPALIAMTYLMNFYETVGISPTNTLEKKPRLVNVSCSSDYCYEVICNTLALSKDELRAFNPELKKTSFPDNHGEFKLKLPYEKAILFWQMEDSIQQASLRAKTWREPTIETKVATKVTKGKTYTVKKGESLPAIARKHHVQVWQLRSWNGLKSNLIYPGQKLIVKAR